MATLAPEIAVHILSAGAAVPPGFWRSAAQLPSLIFSPQAVDIPAGIRGARIVSVPVDKLQELQVMAQAGGTVPETIVIEPHTRLDEGHWGPLVVVKPIRGKKGHGIKLIRTRDVRWTDTNSLPKDHYHHGQALLVQRYVNTGPFIQSTRVMTVLGRPVYSATSTAVEARGDPLKSDAREMDVAANDIERKVTLNYDREIIDFAAAIHSRLPHLPSMGIDVIRDFDTRRLYAVEYNSKGGFWHISSAFGQNQQRTHGIDYMSQFGALDTITDALIEATRKRAI